VIATGGSGRAAARGVALTLWLAVALSLLAWIVVGYSWPLCVAAVVVLLTPLRGLVRGNRYTYAWATLLAIPFLMFALTELLTNGRARWAAATSLLLIFAWFCSLVAFLRFDRAPPE
jgi:uncharacterized membrane protein